MESPPSSSDKVFNYLILRTIVGVIAIALALLTWWIVNVYYADIDIPTSISITYHLGAQDVFVGCLFIVAAFFFSYLGYEGAYSYLNGSSYGSKTTFWVEFVCLTAFGIAWIVSGKQLLIIATPAEKAGKE